MMDLDKYWKRAGELEAKASKGEGLNRIQRKKRRKLIFIKAFIGSRKTFVIPAKSISAVAGFKSRTGVYHLSRSCVNKRVDEAITILRDEIRADMEACDAVRQDS